MFKFFGRRRGRAVAAVSHAAWSGVEQLERRTLLSTASSSSIASGQTLTGVIAGAGDQHNYTFSASSGDTFEVSVGDVSPASSGNEYHPYLQVFDPNNTRVINDTGENGTFGDSDFDVYTVPATAPGKYTITVADYHSDASGGTYALEMLKVPGGIAADSDGDGGAISSGQTKTGTINRVGDMDAFTFSASSGDTFEVSAGDVSPASSGKIYHPYLQVIDPKGNQVINDTRENGTFGDSDFDVYTVPATAVGTYTVIVKDYDSDTSGGTYALEMLKVPGGIAADSDGDGGAISSGQTKTGTINRVGDMDAFTFSAAAGDTFEVSVGDVSPASSGNIYHPYLQVIDPKGNRVINDTRENGTFGDSDFDVYTVPATGVGTYTVIVKDYDGDTSGGTYALEMLKVPGGIAADSDGDGGAISSGQTKTGTINRVGDMDAYTFSASAGDTLEVSVGDVSPAGSGNIYHPYLQVIDPKGNPIINDTRENGTFGDSDFDVFTVPATAVGTYTIIVKDYDGDTSGGTYALEMLKVPGGIGADSNGDGGAISSGQTKTGTINRVGDMDAYTFSGSAGDTFEVSVGDVSPASSGNIYHPYLQIIDPKGNRVINDTRENGTFGDSDFDVYTVPATAVGTYTIVVKDYDGDTSGGTYALEMIKVPGGIAADSDGNGGAITSGQTKTGTINRFGDMDAFTFSASAGDTFGVSVSDVSPASSENKYHPYLQVIDPTGNQVINDTRANGTAGGSLSDSYKIPSTGTGTYTIIVKDYDSDALGGIYSLKLSGTIHPVTTKITVTAPASQTATATISKSFTLGAFTASGATSPYSVDIKWGDGTADTKFTQTSTGTIAAQSHTYAASGTDTVSIVVTDAASHKSNTATFKVTVAAAPKGSISGTVFRDSNSNAKEDSTETGISDVTVYIDANNNSKLDSTEIRTTTNSSGNYTFSGLVAGTYKIRQVLPSGFSQVSPTNNTGHSVTLATNQAVTAENYADFGPSLGSIAGTLFNDANGNGKMDSGEAGIKGWEMFIDANNDNKLDNNEVTLHTDSSGNFTLIHLAAGTYIIRAVAQPGYTQTLPASNGGQHVTITAGQKKTGVLFGEIKAI